MKTTNSVVDGKLSNEQLGGFYRRVNELIRRMNEGTLAHDWVMVELQRVIEGKNEVPCCRKDDFSVTSDGTTGKEWIPRLESKGFRVGNYAKSLLLSPDFKPTSGVIYEIAILKGSLFEDNDRITSKIRVEAERRGLKKPNAEVACLIREKFTDEEIEAIGFWWVIVMHEPINDSDGDPNLLGVDRGGDGRWLDAYCDDPDRRWYRDDGFAFVASQVGS